MRGSMRLFITVFLFFSGQVFSQNITIKGVVSDKVSKERVVNSVVYVLRVKDSIMLDFTRSSANGSFEITKNLPDSIILLISHPDYAEYADFVFFNNKEKVYNLDSIYLTDKIKLLKEIIVNGTLKAIRIKGDTTEYTVDSFYVPPNATVEDLLKKLPGIRVDRNGKITAQGEQVTQILVDGEEFFTDDPTLVTQNLTANMIAKVQVYDKKNDFGNTTKTINLKLKEDKKIGYFGKALYSQGTSGYFNHKLIYNAFKGKRKTSVYGIFSNTGQLGLNTEEEQTFEDPFLSNNNDNFGILDSWNGYYQQKGLPIFKSFGLHFNNKWNNDRQIINGNYKYQNLKINLKETTITQVNLPDTSYYVKENQIAENKGTRNKITGNYELQIDTFTNIKFSVYGEILERKSSYYNTCFTTTSSNSNLNSENRKQTNFGNTNIFNSNLVFTKLWKKPRQRATFTITENYKKDNANSYLFSKDSFYQIGNVFQTQITDQYKTNDYYKLNIETKGTYSHPISSTASLTLVLGLTSINSTSIAGSFNKIPNSTAYEIFDSAYSNDFKFNTNFLRGELGYVLTKSKYFFISGLGFGKTDLIQKDNMFNSQENTSFRNLTPRIHFSYKLASRKRITLKYDGVTNNPTIQQIQRLKSNTNPLNIVIGNSKLKPSFSNISRLVFWTAKTKTERDLTFRIIHTFSKNDFSSSTLTDSFGRKTYQFINVNGNNSIVENLDYEYKFKKINTYFSAKINLIQSKNINIVNNQQNVLKNFSHDIFLNFSKAIEKKLDLEVEFRINQTNSKSSIMYNSKVKYLFYSMSPSLNIFFPLNLQFHTNCDLIFRKSNVTFTNMPNNNIVWNVWLETNLLKNNNLQIRASVSDILNNNVGFSFDTNTSYLVENNYNLVKRHGLISLSWNFNKGKKIEN